MSKKADPPAPPDPRETAAAQTGTNVATALANTSLQQVNQVTPDGTLTYDQTGSTQFRDPTTGQTFDLPQFTATTTLSPEQQAIRDQNNTTSLRLATLGAEQAGRAGELLGRPLSLKGAPARADRSEWGPASYSGDLSVPQYNRNGTSAPELTDTYRGADDFSADRRRIEDALFGQIDEERGRDRESLRTELLNSGLREGTEAYSRAMEDFNESTDEARLNAILAAGGEQSRLVNLDRDAAAFGNQARQQGFQNLEDLRRYDNAVSDSDFANRQSVQLRDDSIQDRTFNQQDAVFNAQDNSRNRELQERLALRNQPLNEIIALLNGTQVATPQFNQASPAGIPTTDYAGLVNNNFNQQLQNYQIAQANRQAALGGLFGLGSAGILAL